MPPHFTLYICLFLLVFGIYLVFAYTCTFHVPTNRDMFVNFRHAHLRKEYQQQGIIHDARRGTLTKCIQYPPYTCQTVQYELPFYQTNDPNSTILTVNKASTNRVLQLQGFPVPNYVYVSNPRALAMTAHDICFSCFKRNVFRFQWWSSL